MVETTINQIYKLIMKKNIVVYSILCLFLYGGGYFIYKYEPKNTHSYESEPIVKFSGEQTIKTNYLTNLFWERATLSDVKKI